MKTTIPPEHQALTPVEVCIKEFGGIRPMARIINRNCGSICKWQKSGLVPTSIQRQVIMRWWWCDSDLIWGSDIDIEEGMSGYPEFSVMTNLSCPRCESQVEVLKKSDAYD